jgi:hypothetical protein
MHAEADGQRRDPGDTPARQDMPDGTPARQEMPAARPDGPDVPAARRRRAAGIYGTVITAAVLASAGANLPTLALAIAVLVTLIVYWVAEQYADVLAEQTAHGRLPTWQGIRTGLGHTWPMVSASYIPVLVLIVVREAGASAVVAANVALGATVVLLLVHGWTAGRAAGLRGARLLVVTLIAGSLGVVMILLKNFVVTNLH